MPADTKYLILRGETWYFRKRHKGTLVRDTLETGDIKEARRRRQQILQELEAGTWGSKRKHTFDEAVELWVEDHFPTLKPKSRQRYRVSLISLMDRFYGVVLKDISSKDLYEFEQTRRRQGVSSSTIIRDLSCLSSLLSSAEEWEWLSGNPVKAYLRNRAKKRALNEGAPRQRFLSHEEERLILDHTGPKASQAIAFAIDTGLRKEEQFGLLKSDILKDTWEVVVRAEVAKSGKERRFPLLPRARELTQLILAVDSASPYLFVTNRGERYSPNSHTMYTLLQRACKRAGIKEHVEWHDLRRTCGCRLLNDLGYTMEEVCSWLGHSSVRVTEQSYAFLNFDRLRERLHANERRVAGASQGDGAQIVSQDAPRPKLIR